VFRSVEPWGIDTRMPSSSFLGAPSARRNAGYGKLVHVRESAGDE
jgi:hypothetical protein